ncbi:MAG: hypothetical protein QM487_09895 [Candidatus Marithrix sp.]
MTSKVFKHELLSITPFQEQLHKTDRLSESLICNHFRDFKKCTWTSTMPVKMNSSMDGDEVVYSVYNTFHFLNDSYMKFTSPSIKIRPDFKGKVQICWCRNMGNNIVESAVFKENNELFNSWDHTWADMYTQWFCQSGSGKRDRYNIGIGNIPELINWTESLPTHNFDVPQPWFYSFYPGLKSSGFPILYKGSQTKAEHRYLFRRKITDLLRVRVLQPDNTWKELPKHLYHKYVNIKSTDTIKMPELWGDFSYVTDNELKQFKCKSEYNYYYRDIIECDSLNPTSEGSVADVPLHSKNPCLAFFWVAENQNATQVNNHSNYTTDNHNIREGSDSINKVTLKYGEIKKFDNMDVDHFSINQVKNFPSAPEHSGYCAFSFSDNPASPDADVAMTFESNVSLHCRLVGPSTDESDCLGEPDIDDSESIHSESLHIEVTPTSDLIEPIIPRSKTNYITRVRLLVLRKFTVKKDDKGDYQFIIE